MAELNRTIALVACVAGKVDYPSAAKDLYTSNWFRKASRFAASVSNDWYILSAEYGLVRPGQVIEPYNKTLKGMPSRERRLWAADVISELRKVVRPADQILMLAGAEYREFLMAPLREFGCSVGIPMEGMRIGEQLYWLQKRLAMMNAH